MAMYTVNCTDFTFGSAVIQEKNNYTSGPSTYNSSFIGVNFHPYEDRYHLAVITRFTAPSFPGESEYMEITWKQVTCTAQTTMCCAICTSDANWKQYASAYGSSFEDKYRIAIGSFTVPSQDLKSMSFQIPTRMLEPSKTYYLFVWKGKQDDAQITTNLGAKLATYAIGYNSGLVYIDNGTSLGSYQCYLDNGSGWDSVLPYIDNGSDWELHS